MCVLPKIVYQGYTWQAYALIAIHHVTDKKPLAGWRHNCTGNGRNLRYRSPTHVGISGPVLPTIGNATTMYVHISIQFKEYNSREYFDISIECLPLFIQRLNLRNK